MSEKDARYKSLRIIAIELAFTTGLVIFMEISLATIGSWFKYNQQNYLYLILLIPAVLGALLILSLRFRAAFYALFALGFAPMGLVVGFLIFYLPRSGIFRGSDHNQINMILPTILPFLIVLGILSIFLIPNIIYVRAAVRRKRESLRR